jgi:parallel beta-helix repeat protein
LPLRPLAACLAAVLGVTDAPATPARPHGAIVVTNCLDSGAGSLRQAVISGAPGDPIDLTQLTCGQISLTTGRIDVNRDLLIQGPGPDVLAIDGTHTDRVFNQNGPYTLALYGLKLQHGYSNAFGGGCVYSKGPLLLNNTVITSCQVLDFGGSGNYLGGAVLANSTLVMINSALTNNQIYSALGNAFGGGASVDGDVVLDHSTITHNSVSNASGGITKSGGMDIAGKLLMMYSTISDNAVGGLANSPGGIGGARVVGGAQISNSTISGNTADGGVGGLMIYGSAASANVIANSTISGNTAAAIGGIYARGQTAILSSTVAFNTETAFANGGGLRIAYSVADIESSIIASNTSSGSPQNINLGISGGVTGANNLIGPSGSVLLPPGTIEADPLLLALADNGGPTRTHALSPASPALDAGNNSAGLTTDQRGSGFPRIVGTAPDIGAFEGVDTDRIFADGFD